MTNNTNINEQPTLWLDLKPEYIDVNLDKFVEYLHDRYDDDEVQDEFYDSSIALLRDRVARLVDYTATGTMGAVQDGQDDLDQLFREVRVLTLYILMKAYCTERELHVAAACAEMLLAKVCSLEYRERLLREAVRMLNSQEAAMVPVDWLHVRNFVPNQLAESLLQTKLSASKNEPLWYEGNGSAKLCDGCLTISTLSRADSKEKKNPKSMGVCNGTIELRSDPSLKLDQLKEDDYVELEAFRKRFVAHLNPAEAKEKQLRRYQAGEELMVRVVRTAYGAVEVSSIDSGYEHIEGKCTFQNQFFYTLQDFVQYLPIGNEIPVVVTRVNGNMSEFDISITFRRFLLEEYEYAQVGCQVLARAVEEKNGYMWWWSDCGYSVSTINRDYTEGGYAWLTISRVDRENGYINAEYDEESEEGFSDVGSRENCIHTFTYEPSEPEGQEQEAADGLDECSLRLMARVLYVLQKQLSHPLDRYKLLCAIQSLCRLTGDGVGTCYAGFVAQTLFNMVLFARGEYSLMDVPEPDECIEELPGVKRRSDIVYILMQYGPESAHDQEYLETKVDDADELLARLAILVQSGIRLRKVLTGPMQRQIEREIMSQLMVDEEAATDFMEDDGSYFGVEDNGREFKTSFVFPPDNQMQPNEAVQKMNVFRGVCALLNSREGGVLYLGVNDHGLVSGVEGDMKALKMPTIDAYMRHINDEAKKAFTLQVLPKIRLEALCDNRVVAIHVDPCDFKVVELDGVAYMRTNAESRKMDKASRMQIEQRLAHYDADRARVESALWAAMDHRKQVVLMGYSSSNSGDCSDRKVEAFAFTSGNTHVWCYELDTEKVKLFAVSRIGDVRETTVPWTYQHRHQKGNLDIFHMTGTAATHVVLLMDLMAKNLLVEEYPDAKGCLTSCKDGRWQLETDVYSLNGIGRFYMGLAKNIEIVEAPGLKEYARRYLKESGLTN